MGGFQAFSAACTSTLARYFLRGWGYGFAVVSRLLFFNLFLLFPTISGEQAGFGHTVALAASIVASVALSIAALHGIGEDIGGGIAHGGLSRVLVALSSASLIVALTVLASAPGWSLGSAGLVVYALGGMGLVVVNALWETALARSGIRAAFTARLGGTFLGSALFAGAFLLPQAMLVLLCGICPLASGIALATWKPTLHEDDGSVAPTCDATLDSRDASQASALWSAPLGIFAIVMLAYVAFGMIRLTTTFGTTSRAFLGISWLLPALTVASTTGAVGIVLHMRRLTVSRIAEVAIPVIAVSVALPVFDGPFSSGDISYLLVYVGCEVLFLFAWIPIISVARSGKCGLLFCFALLGFARWAGSLMGNGVCLLAGSYDRGAVLVMLAAIVCLLVVLHQNSSAETVMIADASVASAPTPGRGVPMSIQDRCDALGGRCGLSAREMEVCYLWVTGHTAPYIEEMLVISKSTVKTHLSHIYEKTGVRTKEQLIQLVEGVQEDCSA